MITAAFFQRHVQACGGDREVALLDVAEEYVLEYMRREGLFDTMLAFKGGTALRKFVFGASGRFSVDLDFALRSGDPGDFDLALDLLNGVELHGVRIDLDRRRGSAAFLRLTTPLGTVVEPAAISVRSQQPWLPVQMMAPQPFEFLDRGLAPEFTRAALPIEDPREMAAEKIAALAALKIYFDVVDEGLGKPPASLADVFGRPRSDVRGAEDLGRLHASAPDVGQLLTQCAQRYAALASLEGALAHLATTCNPRERWTALQAREELVAQLSHP